MAAVARGCGNRLHIQDCPVLRSPHIPEPDDLLHSSALRSSGTKPARHATPVHRAFAQMQGLQMNVQARERVLTELDHVRLATLSSRGLRARLPSSPGIDAVLDDARVVPSRRVASDVVTMYSQVLLRFVDDGIKRKLTLCYPAGRRAPVRLRVRPVADRPESAGSAGRRDGALGVSGRHRADGRSGRDSVPAGGQRRLHDVVGRQLSTATHAAHPGAAVDERKREEAPASGVEGVAWRGPSLQRRFANRNTK